MKRSKKRHHASRKLGMTEMPRRTRWRPLQHSLARFSSILAVASALMAGVREANAAIVWDSDMMDANGVTEASGSFTWNAGQVTFYNTVTMTEQATAMTDVAQFGFGTA